MRSPTPLNRIHALTILLSGVCVPLGRAAPVTFFGHDNPKGTLVSSTAAFNAFTATLSSYGVDNIESYPGFSPDPVLSFGATGLIAQSDISFVAAFPSLAASGNNSLFDAGPAAPGGTGIDDTFTFSAPITAFGSFFSNAGDATANSVSLKLENTALGTSKTLSIGTFGPNNASNNVFFFGVTDTDPFDKVSLIESFDYDGLLLDNVTAGYVAVVPEAGSLMLGSLAAGIGAIAAYRRHRRPWQEDPKRLA